MNAGQYPLSILAMNERAAGLYRTGVYGNTMTANPRAMDVGTAVLGMVTYSIVFDSSWTTADAIANGWNNRGTNDFYDTYTGMTKVQFVGGRAASGDATPFQISVDNWGFLPEPVTMIMLGTGALAVLRRRR